MFPPITQFGWCFLIYSTAYFTPLLFIPILFMIALSLGNLKQRGSGFPSCAFGVSDPISINPKPKFAKLL